MQKKEGEGTCAGESRVGAAASSAGCVHGLAGSRLYRENRLGEVFGCYKRQTEAGCLHEIGR